MVDVASLGIKIDPTPVADLRDRLKELGPAGRDAAGAVRDFQTDTNRMSQQLDQLIRLQQQQNEQLKSQNDLLQSGHLHVSTYADTLLKLGTAAGIVYGAFHLLKAELELFIDIDLKVVRGIGDVLDALSRLQTFGIAGFNTMTDAAIRTQRAIADIAGALGLSGAQYQTFIQQLAPFNNPQGAQGAAQNLAFNLTQNTPGTYAARQDLARLGITATDPNEVMAQLVQAFQGIRPGFARDQLATEILGPEGAKILQDSITGIHEVTDGERALLAMRQKNGEVEADFAEQVRKITDTRSAAFQQSDLLDRLFGRLIGSPGATEAQGVQSGLAGEGFRLGFNQIRQGNVGQGLGTAYASGLSYLLGGTPADYAAVPIPEDASFFTRARLGLRNAFSSGYAAPDLTTRDTTGAAAPPTQEMFNRAMADMATAGEPFRAQMEALQQVFRNLKEDSERGTISMQEFDRAMGAVQLKAADLANPLLAISRTLDVQGALAAFTQGPARQTASQLGLYQLQFLSSDAGAQFRPTNPATGLPYAPGDQRLADPNLFNVLPPEAQSQLRPLMQKWFQENIIQPAIDTLEQSRIQTRAQQAIVAAAESGAPVDIAAAQIRAGFATQIAQAQAVPGQQGIDLVNNLRNQEAEALKRLTASYEQATNVFISSAQAQLSLRLTAGAGRLQTLGGPISPEALIAEAAAGARRVRGLNPADVETPDISDETTQAAFVQNRGLPLQQSLEQMAQRLTIMANTEQAALQQLQSGGGSLLGGQNPLFQLRQQTGVQTLLDEAESARKVYEQIAQSDTGFAEDAKKAAQQLQQFEDAIKGSEKEIVNFREKLAEIRVQQQAQRELSDLQAQVNVLRAGGSPDDLAIAKRAQGFLDRSPGTNPDDAIRWARSIQEADTALKQLIEDQQAWTKAMKDIGNTIGDDVSKLLSGGETFHTFWKTLGSDLSKIGEDYFVKKPLSNLFDSLLSGKGFDFQGAGSGFSSWIGRMFGLGSTGGKDPLQGALQQVATVNMNAGVVNLNGGVGGLPGDLTGGGGGIGGIGGGLFSGGYSGFGQIGDLFNSLIAGDAAMGSFSDPVVGAAITSIFHSGGKIGDAPSASRYVNPLVFASAPRFHSGGLLPDEVPIIAQTGERMLSREQNKAYERSMGRPNVTVNMNVHASNADSFRQSSGQIFRQTFDRIDRMNQRYS